MSTAKIIILIIIGIVGMGLAFYNGYNNSQNKQAGHIIAGLTLGIVILILLI